MCGHSSFHGRAWHYSRESQSGGDLAAPEGLGGWGVSEAVEGFVTTLPRMSGASDGLRQIGRRGVNKERKVVAECGYC